MYIVNIETGQTHQIPSKKQIRYMSIVHDYTDDCTFNPFVSLAYNTCEQKCSLSFSDEHTLQLEIAFDQRKSKIADIDARHFRERNEVEIRIAFVKDQEKLCMFTYNEEVYNSFDRMFD